MPELLLCRPLVPCGFNYRPSFNCRCCCGWGQSACLKALPCWGALQTEKARGVGFLCLCSCSGNGYQPSIPQQVPDRDVGISHQWELVPPKALTCLCKPREGSVKQYSYLQLCLPCQLPCSGVTKISSSWCSQALRNRALSQLLPAPTHH